MQFARALWQRIEAVHAVTYFAPECAAAAKEAGLKGFWMGYYGCRAAPLGTAGPGAVEAVFFNFAPGHVRRSLPDAWSFASPRELIPVRARAAAEVLRRLVPDVDEVAGRVSGPLAEAVAHADPGGRPLFAANRDLPLPEDPVERLWQLCTTLREHRGDGHVALLTAAGIDGLAAHVLIAADQGTDPELLQRARGWTAEDWADRSELLVSAGLLTGAGTLSEAGRNARTAIEDGTDRLAARAYETLTSAQRSALLADLEPAAVRIGRDLIPATNPIGLRPVT